MKLILHRLEEGQQPVFDVAENESAWTLRETEPFIATPTENGAVRVPMMAKRDEHMDFGTLAFDKLIIVDGWNGDFGMVGISRRIQ